MPRVAGMNDMDACAVSSDEETGERNVAMPNIPARLGLIVAATVLALIVGVATPAAAQQRNPDSSVNPTANSVKEDQLFNEFNRISGRCSIPDQKACTIEQPAGRDWREFHQKTLPWVGGIVILGMLAVLVVFYLLRGMVKVEKGRSGRTLVRFNADLLNDPSAINVDMYGKGWLFEMSTVSDADTLSVQEYHDFLAAGWEKTQNMLKGHM